MALFGTPSQAHHLAPLPLALLALFVDVQITTTTTALQYEEGSSVCVAHLAS